MPQIGYSRTLCYAGRMLAPLIGVSTSITVDKDPQRAYVNTAYLRAIQEAGGIPVLLPPQLDEAALGVLWQRLDGLVLTGGGEIDPVRLGLDRHHATGEGTRLGKILGALELEVNSVHHQAIKTLGRGLREVAWAPDGIIEGVELADGNRFVVGVQWHPEELVARDPAACNLFAALVGEARERANR